jgi:hypothetical protein
VETDRAICDRQELLELAVALDMQVIAGRYRASNNAIFCYGLSKYGQGLLRFSKPGICSDILASRNVNAAYLSK